MNCTDLKIFENNLTAYLPLKTVSWSLQGILADYVAGVAVEKCNNFNFTKNNLTVLGNARVGGFPTLDALMIVNSNNSYVGDNKIDEKIQYLILANIVIFMELMCTNVMTLLLTTILLI